MLAEDGLRKVGARTWDHSRIIDPVRVAGPERMLTWGARGVRYSDFDASSGFTTSAAW
jgi:hypothetical protein